MSKPRYAVHPGRTFGGGYYTFIEVCAQHGIDPRGVLNMAHPAHVELAGNREDIIHLYPRHELQETADSWNRSTAAASNPTKPDIKGEK